jgi:CheY-like chemotaxis protein/two-component sensor histidine kinase
MSHELRTPLNAILGFGQLLETASLETEDREGVGHIVKAGRHLLALINDVLDLSRIEADMLAISMEPVRVGDVVDDAVALIRPGATARSIAIRIDGSACDEHVMTDRQRCRQVLLNLLSNAVKYNHDRGEVDVTCQRRDEQTLRIAVRDTGAGIDAGGQQRLFEPFERLGAEQSSIEGTGLGLALTKQLIERLGGSIGLHSTPGEGSTFWIDVPLTTPPTGTDEAAPPTRPSTSATHTVLVVEDNLANLRVVEAMLRQRPGIEVLPAMQGTIALELAREHLPDILVLDLHLPDMSGRDVLKRLKADPRIQHIPVVIASADATPGRIEQLREDGAFRYITKPLDLRQFLDTIDDALTASSEAPPVTPETSIEGGL